MIDNDLDRLIKTLRKPHPSLDRRILPAASAAMQEAARLSAAKRRVLRICLSWGGGLAAAAGLLFAAFLLQGRPSADGPVADATIGRVQRSGGTVCVANGSGPRPLADGQKLHSGQWIETRSYSQAEILLADQTRLWVQPCSLVQFNQAQSEKVLLQLGTLCAEVARQPAGHPLTIQTPNAAVRVLGTKLDVHVIQKLDGRRQTRVSVTSGKVELESAGRKVLLPPNTEGVADEGQPPVARSQLTEINELNRLADLTRELADEAGLPAGDPAIIDIDDDTSATVWQVLTIDNATAAEMRSWTLPDASPAGGAEAFTLDSTPLPVTTEQGSLQIDLSSQQPVAPNSQRKVILKARGIRGLLESLDAGTFQLDRPGDGPQVRSLLQVRLPGKAKIDQLSPEPIEVRNLPSRLIVTIPVDSPNLGLVR